MTRSAKSVITEPDALLPKITDNPIDKLTY